MSRRPAAFTATEIDRMAKLAKREDVCVEMEMNGRIIRVMPKPLDQETRKRPASIEHIDL